MSKGSYLGGISMLDGREREITAIALSEVSCYRISSEKLTQLRAVDYSTLVKFYISVVRDLNSRLRRANEEYGKIKEKLSGA